MPIILRNVDKAQAQVYGYPKKFTKNVRQEMNGKGFEIVKKNVLRGMPVSGSNRKRHIHARDGNSIRRMTLKGKRDYQVVGFYATFYKKYYYLKFPNEGTGQSRRNRPKKFLEKGALNSRGEIKRLVNGAIKSSHIR